MDELFDNLDRLRASERRVAMATLVATRGTTPKKEGAKMWVGEGGRILGSVTIGGCVDAQVIAEADAVLAAGAPRLLSMTLGEEDAWDLGLTCSGTVEVLIEPLDFGRAGDAAVAAYDAVRSALAAGPAALVTRLPDAGARVVVRADGSLVGTLGDSVVDAAAREAGLRAVRDGRARTVALRGAADAEREVAAFVEPHGPPPTLLVVGATSVAMALVTFARGLGWRTVVVDGRERFATRERFPDADEIRVGIVDEVSADVPLGPATFVVLTAHDYKYELPVLRRVLPATVAYIGLLGSRRRGQALREFLAQEGFDAAALERIHVPVGLDIGAQSAAEIALSILAQAVAVRAGRGPAADAPPTGAASRAVACPA